MLVQTLPGAREKHGEKLIRFKFQHFRRAGITGGSGVNLQSQEALEATSCSTCDLCKNVNALGSKDAYTHMPPTLTVTANPRNPPQGPRRLEALLRYED